MDTKSIVITIIIVVFILFIGAIWFGANKSGHSSQSSQNQQVQNAPSYSNSLATSTSSGLVIKDDVIGTGTEAKDGDTVVVNYVGTLDSGKKFDSSYDRNQPFTFTIGTHQVIPGWEMGVPGMRVGGKRELIIPPEFGYGLSGYPPIIPPNSTLHFTIELLSVK